MILYVALSGTSLAARVSPPQPPDNVDCVVEEANSTDKLIAVGVYEGAALSDVAVASQDDVTTVVDISIEDGTEPIHLVLSSVSPVVWRFSGAVQSVAKASVSSKKGDSAGNSAAGVVGLARSQVELLDAQCLPRIMKGSEERSFEIVTRLFGQTPLIVPAGYEVTRVSLPSGRVTPSLMRDEAASRFPTPRGFDPRLWTKFIENKSGGLVALSAETVVSRAIVAPYEMLPEEAGLSKLVGLRKLGSGLIEATRR